MANDELTEAIRDELDSTMQAAGFQRPKRSLVFTRNVAASRQSIEITVQRRPRWQPDAVDYLYPWTRVEFTRISDTALELVNSNVFLIGSGHAAIAQPIEFICPKDQRVQWYTFGTSGDYVRCVRSMKEVILRHVIPFLDDYSDPMSLIKYFEQGDERLPYQRRLALFIAAACIVNGQAAKALEVLEAKLGKPGPREQYSSAFEYVHRALRAAV